MMDYEELTKQFKTRVPLFEQLREEALYALSQAIKVAGIKYHSFPSRVKELDSFLEKVRSREAKEPLGAPDTDWNPLEAIHDIVGLRVVCLYLSDLTRIAVVIRDTFEVLSEDNKIEGAEVSSFGYMSVHFVAKMKQAYTGPRYDKIAGLLFEIQVRTIAMDAWANVSHHLDYKTDKDVPAELRKDFYALSGLFYVADRHFEMFYSQSTQSRKQMKELFEDTASLEDKARQELNLDTLSAYLATKFPERNHSGSKDVSILLNSLLTSGYTTVGEIDQLIDRGEQAFRLYEQEKHTTEGQFWDVGVVRVTMHILDDRFIREDGKYFGVDEGELDEYVRQIKGNYEKYRKLVE
ncbi:MAG TPA: hypothetical protein VJM50_23240 [Pyrinomonadaceae bacterium]|nr:hypothetical protein [Pyrinomonadaceae bacterium]